MYERLLYNPTEQEKEHIKEQLKLNKRSKIILIIQAVGLAILFTAPFLYQLYGFIQKIKDNYLGYIIPAVICMSACVIVYIITGYIAIGILAELNATPDNLYYLCATMIDSKAVRINKSKKKKKYKYIANMKLDNEDILNSMRIDPKYYQKDGSRFILAFKEMPKKCIPQIEFIIPK